MNMPARNFRDLRAWQAAYSLTLEIYRVTAGFPKDEIFGLTSQIRRAVISVTSNIAEGFGRRGRKEKDNFYSIAHGSLTEVENQLMIAKGVGYLSDDVYQKIDDMVIQSHRLLYGLRKANQEKGAGE